jgi:hypothetical protein
MERIWLGNIAPGTSDDELRDLFKKYAPELECVEILHEEGTGARPAALCSFTHKSLDSLGKLAMRLNGLYWKERRLSCSTTIAPG